MVEGNLLLAAVLGLYAASAGFRQFLIRLNIRHIRRHGGTVPAVFAGWIDAGTLARMAEYTVARLRFGACSAAYRDVLVLAVLLAGVLPWLHGMLNARGVPFVVAGLLFFGVLSLGEGILTVPFDLYETFRLEKRYGFSTITARVWIADRFKGLVLTVLVGGSLLGALLALLRYTPATWWLWVWLVFASFQLLAMWLYPVLIAPLFHRFTPLADEALREAIVALAARAGLTAEGVYQVNAGIRSTHSNAYFTGVGATKRIVLYDSLLASHPSDEIVAVLGHEIGHGKKRHLLRQLLLMETLSLAVLYGASLLLPWPLLYETFGFAEPVPYAGLILIGIPAEGAAFFLMPAFAALLRRYEREADDYSREILGGTASLRNALRRLAKDNLANLHPHPLYARFFSTHPPLAERIARLEKQEHGEKPA
jgi:STE24 endopeptidase